LNPGAELSDPKTLLIDSKKVIQINLLVERVRSQTAPQSHWTDFSMHHPSQSQDEAEDSGINNTPQSNPSSSSLG